MIKASAGSRRRAAAIAGLVAISSPSAPAGAAPDAPPDAPSAPAPGAEARPGGQETGARESARWHFDKGLSLYDAGAWDAAYAEFLRSRSLHPTRAATQNAALCLRRLRRYDEELEMLELLLAFPELTAPERAWAERELAAVRGLVGSLVLDVAEPGAAISIDGRARGATPAPAPLRVPAGSRVVRVFKPGFAPAEVRVDVAGGQSVPVRIQLTPLVHSGWIRVEEVAGKALDVVVDNVVVGKTPWKGLVPPGEHVVFLRGESRGEGRLGTQPAAASVRLNQVTELKLLAETLSAALRVEPTPASASVVIDGVSVGRGSWDGALRPGVHRVAIAAEGFVPQARDVTLRESAREVLRAALEPVQGPPLWWAQARLFVEAEGYLGVLPGFGGDVAGRCAGGCSAPPGLAFAALGRAGYRFPAGVLLAVEAGYLTARQTIAGRPEAVTPTGLAPNPGTADDTLLLRGALLGVSPGVRLDAPVPLTFALGAGAFLGTLVDRRAGRFTPRSGSPYEVGATETLTAQGLYVAPEVQIRARLGERLELGAGARATLVVLPRQPRWAPEEGYVLAASDGQGRFPEARLSGPVLTAFTPGLVALYEF
ncbi:PEGA domain-containing protein [Sorangium sp. So ce1389]|uniref:PEGA domain-containing protein n=1 Tax=Sorangium sp. So ce1389 TaxID=3133336 RepID=UPI003F645D0D